MLISCLALTQSRRCWCQQCATYATSVTSFPVYSFHDLENRLEAFAASRSGTLDLAGAAYIPADPPKRIEASIGDLRLEPTSILAEIKAVKSDREVVLLRELLR